MQANKENIDSIHRIDPESTGEIAGRFEELVHLLETESDDRVLAHVDAFHHSDLADAIGLLDRESEKEVTRSGQGRLGP